MKLRYDCCGAHSNGKEDVYVAVVSDDVIV